MVNVERINEQVFQAVIAWWKTVFEHNIVTLGHISMVSFFKTLGLRNNFVQYFLKFTK